MADTQANLGSAPSRHPHRHAWIYGLAVIAVIGAMSLLPDPPQGATRVMLLGDSITYGTTEPASAFDGGYAARLAASEGERFSFANEGHEGWTAEWLLIGRPGDRRSGNLYQWLAKDRPEIVVLLIGTNDLNHTHDVGLAIKRVERLLDKLKGMEVYVMPIPPVTANEKVGIDRAQVGQFNEGLRGSVKSRPGVEWVETRDVLTDADISSDGVHPAASGYAKIAERVRDALDRKHAP